MGDVESLSEAEAKKGFKSGQLESYKENWENIKKIWRGLKK